MRIDAHHHVWNLGVRDQPWLIALPSLRRSFAIEELRPSLLRHRIDATVLVQTIPIPEETPELLDLAESDPQVAGVVGWVELTAPDVADRLAELELASNALVGIRHPVQDEPDPGYLDRREVRRGIAAVGAAGLAYDLLVRPTQLPAAVAAARALPEVRFVLDHGGKPSIATAALAPWQDQIHELAACPNVSVKLSGLVTEAAADWTLESLRPYATVMLEAFGARRVMFGSDWPVCLLAATYDEVIGAANDLTEQLSPDERAEVFGGSAARWYRLA
jgi:L-fuconolactonase